MVFENSSGKLWNLQMQKLERNEFCTVLKGEEEMYYLWSSHDWLLTTSWLEEIRGKNSNWRGSGKEKTSIKQHLAPMQRTMHNYSVRHKLHSDQTFGMTSHSPTNYCAKSGSATTRRLRLELAKQLLQKQTVTTNKPRWNQHLNNLSWSARHENHNKIQLITTNLRSGYTTKMISRELQKLRKQQGNTINDAPSTRSRNRPKQTTGGQWQHRGRVELVERQRFAERRGTRIVS